MLKKPRRLVGLGHYTACAYQFVFHENVKKEIIIVVQYFVMPGLGSTVPIEHEAGHTMRADTFSHFTSLALTIQEGMVHWVSNGSVSIVAWGTWQRSVQYSEGVRTTNSPTPSLSGVDNLVDESEDSDIEIDLENEKVQENPDIVEIQGEFSKRLEIWYSGRHIYSLPVLLFYDVYSR